MWEVHWTISAICCFPSGGIFEVLSEVSNMKASATSSGDCTQPPYCFHLMAFGSRSSHFAAILEGLRITTAPAERLVFPHHLLKGIHRAVSLKSRIRLYFAGSCD